MLLFFSFKKRSLYFLLLVLFCIVVLAGEYFLLSSDKNSTKTVADEDEKETIQWVDFDVPMEAMDKALDLDIGSQDKAIKLNWIELLACLAAQNGNNFNRYKDRQLDDLAQKLESGQTMTELTKDMKYYSYYYQAYSAILRNFVGSYEIEVPNEDGMGKHWEEK